MKMKILMAAAAAVTIGSAFAWSPPLAAPAAAMPVFDSTNYAQNLLQAARALEQINNQVQSLQNEAAMLQGLAKNLKTLDFKELGALTGKLHDIDRLMGEAQGIGFRTQELERQYASLFPGDWSLKSKDARIADAKSRVETAMAAFRHSMTVQARVIENVEEDARLLKALASRSQGAEGSLQAQQATNQLLVLAAKQQLQLQSLLASQFRGEAIAQAQRTRSEEEGRSATRRFLGSGTAYHHIPK